ncbi:MAG: hypothetical protein WD076_06220 [Parvularculaceae bacterium]
MTRLFKAGLAAGFVGGALDFAAASTIYPMAYPGLTVERIWQSVAEGVLGKASYDGGMTAVLIGVALHFFIALCAGVVLALVMSRADLFRRLWPVSGVAYGVSMYYFMQLVVLPLSMIGARHPDLKSTAIGLGIHIVIFGLPSAFVAGRVLSNKG